MRKILLLFFSIIYFVTCGNSKNMIISPITIQVIDSNKKPVKNMKVYYSIEKEYYKPEIPFIPAHNAKHLFENYEFMTDENGELTIPQHTVKLRNHEYLTEEFIYINIDINEKKFHYPKVVQFININEKKFNYPEGVQFLNPFYEEVRNVDSCFNPLSEYRGVVIFSSFYEVKPSYYTGVYKKKGMYRKKFDIQVDSEGILRHNRLYKVQLKRYNKNDVKIYEQKLEEFFRYRHGKK